MARFLETYYFGLEGQDITDEEYWDLRISEPSLENTLKNGGQLITEYDGICHGPNYGKPFIFKTLIRTPGKRDRVIKYHSDKSEAYKFHANEAAL